MQLPHDAAIGQPRHPAHPSGPGGAYAWTGTAAYRKRFIAPPAWREQRVVIEFEGVMMHAEVSLNGQLLALQPYGYTSFLVDLTAALDPTDLNELIVVANNSAQPNSRWYTGTGLYRHVWLHCGGALHIPPWGVFVSTPVAEAGAAQIAVATTIANTGATPAHVTLHTQVLAPDGELVGVVESSITLAGQASTPVAQTLTIDHPQRWAIETPFLYTLRSTLRHQEAVCDQVDTTFGIRSLTLDPQEGLRLNGAPLKLRGGNIHHDHGPLGAASYDRAEERKVELLKSAGFNALRCAHNPPAPALLAACDRLGMLVINEAFDMWRMAKTTNDYHLYFEDWWQRDLTALVLRDRNHPSVIMWSVGNEVLEANGGPDGGAAWAQRLAACVRALDPTRPVTMGLASLPAEFAPFMAQGIEVGFAAMLAAAPPTAATDRWGPHTAALAAALDVVGYNYMPQRYSYDIQAYPDRLICGTESFPAQAYTSWQAVSCSPAVLGDFVWTAIDYLGESGLAQVVYDTPLPGYHGAYPYHLAACGDFDCCGGKRPQSFFRDILWGVRAAPFLAVCPPAHAGQSAHMSPWAWDPVVASWTFPDWEGTLVRVDVYSDADAVELFLNGVSHGRRPAGAVQHNTTSFTLAYAPGVLEAVAYSDGTETGRTALTTAGAPQRLRLSPDRAVLVASAADLSYILVEIVDAAGALVPYTSHPVTIAVRGAGALLAIGSADPCSEESYIGTQRRAYAGRLLAIVRSTNQSGPLTVTATAAGLLAGEAVLDVR